MPSPLAVTGSGLVTAAGRGVAAAWDALCAGTCFLTPDDRDGLEGFSPIASARCAPIDPESLGVDRRATRIIGHHTHLLLAAVSDAIGEAGGEAGGVGGDETGFFAGMDSVDPGDDDLEAALRASGAVGEVGETGGVDFGRFFSEGMAHIHPLWPLGMLNPIGFSQVSIQFGLRGENGLFSPGSEAAAQALIEAGESIREQKTRVSLAAGVSPEVTPRAVARYREQGFLRAAGVPDAELPLPFSGRGAAALGEGAGAVVLESVEAARAGGKTIQGLLLGWGRATALEKSGGLAAAIRESSSRALEAAGIGPERVDLVIPHGAGTLEEDAAEAEALSSVFSARRPRALATKGAFGHLLGGSTMMDILLALRAIKEGRVPPSPGAGDAAGGALEFSASPEDARLDTVLVLSRGIEGACAAFVAGVA